MNARQKSPSDQPSRYVLVVQVESLLRLLQPDHLTPQGARMVERVLRESSATAAEWLSCEETT